MKNSNHASCKIILLLKTGVKNNCKIKLQFTDDNLPPANYIIDRIRLIRGKI